MINLKLPKTHNGIFYTKNNFRFIIWVLTPPSVRNMILENIENDEPEYFKVKLPQMAVGCLITYDAVAAKINPVFDKYSFINKNKILFQGPPHSEEGSICWGDVSSKINFTNLESEFWNSGSDMYIDDIDYYKRNGLIHFKYGKDSFEESSKLNLISKTGSRIKLSTDKISDFKVNAYYNLDLYIKVIQ